MIALINFNGPTHSLSSRINVSRKIKIENFINTTIYKLQKRRPCCGKNNKSWESIEKHTGTCMCACMAYILIYTWERESWETTVQNVTRHTLTNFYYFHHLYLILYCFSHFIFLRNLLNNLAVACYHSPWLCFMSILMNKGFVC